ncbi:hypothetical protein LCGC14_2184910 [marine sediment metagenome]|uniref:Uncharacterized protein n=1 Tax=marine sediment metagenome TaxID=412755 RepID=A0A0F9DL49_9ZZZZ
MTEETKLKELRLHEVLTINNQAFDRIVVQRVLTGYIYTYFYTEDETIMDSVYVPAPTE